MARVAAIVCVAAAAAVPAATARADRVVTLRADVAEWSIVPSSGAVPSGRIRIEVRNLGASAHEVVLVRTRFFAAPLPLRAHRAVVTPVASTRLLRAGERASFVVTLRPGSYELLDNLPWHYWKGTSAAFSVR